jgi:hypothetical protein
MRLEHSSCQVLASESGSAHRHGMVHDSDSGPGARAAGPAAAGKPSRIELRVGQSRTKLFGSDSLGPLSLIKENDSDPCTPAPAVTVTVTVTVERQRRQCMRVRRMRQHACTPAHRDTAGLRTLTRPRGRPAKFRCRGLRQKRPGAGLPANLNPSPIMIPGFAFCNLHFSKFSYKSCTLLKFKLSVSSAAAASDRPPPLPTRTWHWYGPGVGLLNPSAFAGPGAGGQCSLPLFSSQA